MKVRANLSSNDGGSALSWALDGQGILWRSQWEVAKLVREERLVPVLQDWLSPSADIYAVFQTTNQMPAKVRALVKLLLKEFASRRGQGNELLGRW